MMDSFSKKTTLRHHILCMRPVLLQLHTIPHYWVQAGSYDELA